MKDRLKFRLVKTYQHDHLAFTQGLTYHNGRLFESTGLLSHSDIREVDLCSGTIIKRVALDSNLFGEGIAIHNSKIFQGLLGGRKILVWDMNSFELLESIVYSHEIWGMAVYGDNLLVSDGSNIIRLMDLNSGNIVDLIKIHHNNEEVLFINDIQVIDSKIFANIWTTNTVARIDIETGVVDGWLDLHDLRPVETRHKPNAVLNGIAYCPERNSLLVTGKHWSVLHEIVFEE